MIGRPASIARFPGGSPIPPPDPIVVPGASYAVAPSPINRDRGARGKAAMEMPALSTPQNGVHSALEISQRTRDSHISTAAPCVSRQDDDEEEEEDDERQASLTTTGQPTLD